MIWCKISPCGSWSLSSKPSNISKKTFFLWSGPFVYSRIFVTICPLPCWFSLLSSWTAASVNPYNLLYMYCRWWNILLCHDYTAIWPSVPRLLWFDSILQLRPRGGSKYLGADSDCWKRNNWCFSALYRLHHWFCALPWLHEWETDTWHKTVTQTHIQTQVNRYCTIIIFFRWTSFCCL